MQYCSYQITIFANLPPLVSAAWCGPHPRTPLATPYIVNVIFSEPRSLYAIARPSFVCRLSVTLVRPTQAVEIFGNISKAFGTLAIR